IALIASRFGFRPFYILVASVLGEGVGLFLYAAYNHWKVTAVLSGLASGSLAYRGTQGPRSLLAGVVMFSGIGVTIAAFVLIGHWIFQRAKSA
ncbi:MAG: hypothetical protein ABR585_15080, partial [Gemmatimonadaceae bacterium]